MHKTLLQEYSAGSITNPDLNHQATVHLKPTVLLRLKLRICNFSGVQALGCEVQVRRLMSHSYAYLSDRVIHMDSAA